MAAENPNPETGEVNLFTAEFAACPQPVYRRMLSQCPVTRAALSGGPVIASYEDVIWALRHPDIFSSEMEIEIDLGTERPMIPQQIDPPAQTRFRKILDPRFSKRRMAEVEPKVRKSANELIDRFLDRGECDFHKEFAVPLPCNAFLALMGLPQEDLPVFLDLKDGIIRPHSVTGSMDLEENSAHRSATGKRIYAYFEKIIDQRSTARRDDMMSYFLDAEIDGHKLSRNDILDICFLFLLAGLDTITATLGCNFAYLATNPEQRQKLVSQPEILDKAVEELLRWETPVTGVPRVATRDITLGGLEIKQGELVTLLLGASNTDDAEFGNAADVDLERERNRHLAFGGGAHRCLGSHLARMELRVAMEEWHRRIPEYRVADGETPLYSPGIREVHHLPLIWK